MILNIERERLQAILGDQFDPNWLKELLKTNLNNFFSYRKFENESLNIQADMTPIAEALAGDNGIAIIDAIIEETRRFDDCTDAELQLIDTLIASDSEIGGLPPCNPGEENLALLRTYLEQARTYMLSELGNLPDYQLDLRRQLSRNSAELEEFDRSAFEIRRILIFVDNAIVILLFLPIMLMSLVIVFAIRSAKGFFLWTGLAMIETAFLTLFPLLPYIYNLVANPQRAALSGNTNTEYVLIFELLGLLFSSFAPAIFAIVALLTFVGISFLILASLLKVPQVQTQQPVYYMMPSNTLAVNTTPTPSAMPIPTTPSPLPRRKRLSTFSAQSSETPTTSNSESDLPDDHTFIPTEE
ncbi:MAG: hypothetical protein CUN55_14280 [Phototrophicales bacterium]|nr:MAG: hypothetical protein CUN55_14280 [Phototrophicales bacterium]